MIEKKYIINGKTTVEVAVEKDLVVFNDWLFTVPLKDISELIQVLLEITEDVGYEGDKEEEPLR